MYLSSVEGPNRRGRPLGRWEDIVKEYLLLLLNITEKADWDERKRYKLPDDNSEPP